jgi:hypothetical protein
MRPLCAPVIAHDDGGADRDRAAAPAKSLGWERAAYERVEFARERKLL